MPLFHIGGMQFILMAVKFGIPHLMMRGFDPAAMLAAIDNPELGITNIGGVPAMWGAMSLMPNIDDIDFSRIRVAATGAECASLPRVWPECPAISSPKSQRYAQCAISVVMYARSCHVAFFRVAVRSTRG